MNDDMLMDTLEAVRMQSMQESGWQWDDDAASLDCEGYDIFALAFFMPESADDPVWNSVRYGYCEAIHTVVRLWYRDYRRPGDYEELNEDQESLVYQCLSRPNPQDITWRDYVDAMRGEWPLSFLDAQYDAIEDSEGRYSFEIRHVVKPTDDGYVVNTKVAGGWQDIWPVDITVNVPGDASQTELVNIIKAAYPAALTEGL